LLLLLLQLVLLLLVLLQLLLQQELLLRVTLQHLQYIVPLDTIALAWRADVLKGTQLSVHQYGCAIR
jgi:hypothetical protein